MDQFMKLPPGQKAAVLAAALGLIGVGFYFLLVDPELVRADQARGNISRVEKELADLRQLATPEEQERLRKLKDDLIELDKENRKMLPSAAEIPDFIDSVQRDAQRLGLQVRRFDRLPEESQDLVNAIPIRMVVEGSTKDFIQFLRVYAGPDRRIVNMRELNIEQVQPDVGALRTQLLARKPPDANGEKGGQTKNPAELLLEQIEIAELARETAQIRATFTAYAFTWTGKPMQNLEGSSQSRKSKKKRT